MVFRPTSMRKSGNVLGGFSCSRWWLPISKARTLFVVYMLTVVLPCVSAVDPSSQDAVKVQIAYINISYMDRETKKEEFKKYEGTFGKDSIVAAASGVVMHAISLPNKSGTTVNNFGCTNYINTKFPSEQWIALVKRGECSFTNKLKMATKEHNASAIVIYNNESTITPQMQTLDIDKKAVPGISVILSQEDGKQIAQLLESGYTVHMQIIPGPEENINQQAQNSISKTSVLFVSISFIVLMVISLAWLVFYYIQRFRYSHAKERLARRLVCAAKKAIAKIPQRTVKVGDKELDSEFDQCAVCIEPYKAHDVIRILPCRHVFHKSCVDPWLLDQRSCPMCKLDILRAFGMQIGGSQESVHPDPEAGQVIVVVQEPEISSSVEDTQTEEIKVLLVPHNCLHFTSGRDKIPADDEEASSSLLGAIGGTVCKSSSASSLNSKGSKYSRAEKSDKAEGVSSEMKALIGKGQGKRGHWHSREEGHEDEEEDDPDEIVIRNIESIMNVIETVKKDQKVNVIDNQDEDIERGSMDSSSFVSLSQSNSFSLEHLKSQASVSYEDSEPDIRNVEFSKDIQSMTTFNGAENICPDNVKAEFHQDGIGTDVESTA